MTREVAKKRKITENFRWWEGSIFCLVNGLVRASLNQSRGWRELPLQRKTIVRWSIEICFFSIWLRWHRGTSALKLDFVWLGGFFCLHKRKEEKKMRKTKKVNGDCLTPINLYYRLRDEKSCLLERIPREKDNGRYSVIAFDQAHNVKYA